MQATEADPGYAFVPFNASHPRASSPWHKITPESLYWAPRYLKSLWNVENIYITESGCGASDAPDDDGNVYDTDRIAMRSYLTQLQRATADGVPVRGYFQWSTMDNFEWFYGYEIRFGLIYVDYVTQKRTPKLSASYFREVATHNRVM